MKMLAPAAFWLLIYALVVNCHPSDVPASCQVTKPLEELAWLKAIVADTVATEGQELSIQQATYKGRTIYSVYITPGPDRGVNTLYDCQGTVLCQGNITLAGLQTDCKDVFNGTHSYSLLYSR